MLGVLKASRKVEVHFVDFGNREVVECEDLRDMPAEFLNDLPVHAVACSLYGVDQAGGISVWSPTDVDTFSNMVCDQLLEVYFTHRQNSDGHHLVHLLKDQQNINRTFLQSAKKLSVGYFSPVDPVAAGDASWTAKRKLSVDSGSTEEADGASLRGYKYEACMPGEQVNCVAAYVVSPSRFFLHRSTDTDALDALISDLTSEYEHRTQTHTLNVSVGQPCCALYGDDNQWYRAKLVGMSNEHRRHLSVEFVDYGNTETVDAGVVHRLRSRFFTLPVQALHCQLAGVVPVTGSDWSDEAAAFFEEALGDSAHLVKVVSESEFIHTVEMKSVAQKLIESGFARQKAEPGAIIGRTARAVDSSRGLRQHETHQFATRKSTTSQSESGSSTGGFAMDKDLMGGTHDADSSVSVLMDFSPMNVAADTRHSVVVSWVVSPSEFYCQLVDNCSVIEKLSLDLREFYQTSGHRAISASECTAGRPCVAFYEPDKSWYRGRIVSCASDQVTVFYVDYGNTEVVHIGQVRQAQLQFLKSAPVQAIKCLLLGADKRESDWTKNELTSFDTAVSAPGLTCRFVNNRGDIYVVELSDQSGRDLTTSLFSSKSTVAGTRTMPSKPAVKAYVHECGLKVNDVVQLEVVYVTDGGTVFNCHVVGQTDDLDELMGELGNDCERRPALRSLPDVGQPCAALFSEDSCWYRAIVDSIPADDAEHRIVKFVDYGNIESCSVSSLRELDSRFLCVPVRRVDCQLNGMTAPSLDDVATDLLGQQFTATVISIDRSNVVTVELKTLDTDESFASTHKELFMQSTVPPRGVSTVSLPTTEPPDDEVDVYVTHVVSPSDLYIQMASVEQQLTELVEQLMEEYERSNSDNTSLSDVTVGSVCCARYSVDGSWYRAVVEDVGDDTVNVRFVDYGNSDVVSRGDIRRISDQFTTVPVCAWHCQLSNQSNSAICWTDAQRQKLVDLAEAGEKLFKCSFVSSSHPYPVILKDGDVDIGQQLFDLSNNEPVISVHVAETLNDLPVAEPPSDITDVCVTSAESPSDFYVQLTSAEDELSQLADELLDEYDSTSASERQLTNVKVGNLCCARFSGAWYRAVVTEVVDPGEVHVLYIDYGNSEVVSASSDVKQLSAKFCTKPPFVYHCELAGVSRQPADWTDELKTKFISLTVTDDEVPMVFSCQFLTHDVNTGCHSVSLKSVDDVDLSSLFAVSKSDEGREVTCQPQQSIQPAVVLPGKHMVSLLSLVPCWSREL